MNRYKKHLLEAEGNMVEFKTRFGDLARNARGWMNLGLPELKELQHQLRYGVVDEIEEETYKLAISMIKQFYNKPLPEVTLKSRKIKNRWTRSNVDTYNWMKKGHDRMIKTYYSHLAIASIIGEDPVMNNPGSFHYDFELEELVPVIHGGCFGRINAAIYHGRGYETTVPMPNQDKQVFEKTGLMFHSEYSGRAKAYARDAANQRVGMQAVLMAFVPKWALYHNQGDEYSLPYWHYDQLQNVRVVSMGHEPDLYMKVEDYYREHYLKAVLV